MAMRQSGKPPHKFGDKGLRHEHPGRQVFRIGDGITVVVRRYAGRIVTTIDAPAGVKISVGESDLQKIGNS